VKSLNSWLYFSMLVLTLDDIFSIFRLLTIQTGERGENPLLCRNCKKFIDEILKQVQDDNK